MESKVPWRYSKHFVAGPYLGTCVFSPSPHVTAAGIHQWYRARLRAGRSGVRIPGGTGNFSLHHRVQPALGPTQSLIQWEPGVLYLGVKWPGRETDHSHPSSAEVKNAWRYTSTPSNAAPWRRSQLKHTDSFTFFTRHIPFLYLFIMLKFSSQLRLGLSSFLSFKFSN
jgi:hypothetical protein